MSTQSVNTDQQKTVRMQTRISGDGKPLVLVPGGLTGWLSWEPHAARLSASRKVIRVQLLNVQYGLENRALPADYSVKTESRALKAALDQPGLDYPLDIAAWSFGAEITLDFALDNPSRIRSLILIEPPAYWVLRAADKLDDEAKKNQEVLLAMRGEISEEHLAQFATTVGLVPPGQSPQQLPQWALWVQHRRSLLNNPAVILHNDDLKRVKEFQPPVLLVKGSGSAKFLHQIIDLLAAQFPHCRTVEMPAGHAPQIVSMDRFLQEMENFQKSAV